MTKYLTDEQKKTLAALAIKDHTKVGRSCVHCVNNNSFVPIYFKRDWPYFWRWKIITYEETCPYATRCSSPHRIDPMIWGGSEFYPNGHDHYELDLVVYYDRYLDPK